MNMQTFIPPFLLAWFVSMMATLWMVRVAHKYQVLDHPDTGVGARKIHRIATPLLGGVAVFLSFWLIIALWLNPFDLLSGFLLPKHLVGMFLGGLVLMIGGAWDDKRNLPARNQILFPVLAVLIVIASGVGVSSLSIPYVGMLDFSRWSTELFTINGLPYHIVWIADAVTFVWLMLMMYATKFSDSVDGLVTGVSGIGALVVFFLSLSNDVVQPETALLAIVFAGSALGFLVFNWNPAMIFLGESGSVWFGFMLGVLSVLAGSKIATTLIVMGLPLLDLVWVIARRVFVERRNPTHGDRKHLSHRLLDVGFSQRKTVLLLYAITTIFGVSSLFVTRESKLWVLGLLLLVMVCLAGWLVWRARKRRTTSVV